jgi:hypothetical protein
METVTVKSGYRTGRKGHMLAKDERTELANGGIKATTSSYPTSQQIQWTQSTLMFYSRLRRNSIGSTTSRQTFQSPRSKIDVWSRVFQVAAPKTTRAGNKPIK